MKDKKGKKVRAGAIPKKKMTKPKGSKRRDMARPTKSSAKGMKNNGLYSPNAF